MTGPLGLAPTVRCIARQLPRREFPRPKGGGAEVLQRGDPSPPRNESDPSVSVVLQSGCASHRSPPVSSPRNRWRQE